MYRLFMKFSCILTFVPIILNAGNPVQSQELRDIDAQLTKLKGFLEKNRIEKHNEEVESQKYMIDDWSKYSKEVQGIQDKELYKKSILEEIQKLEAQKEKLYQNNIPQN